MAIASAAFSVLLRFVKTRVLQHEMRTWRVLTFIKSSTYGGRKYEKTGAIEPALCVHGRGGSAKQPNPTVRLRAGIQHSIGTGNQQQRTRRSRVRQEPSAQRRPQRGEDRRTSAASTPHAALLFPL